eukprot:1158924-Pelagomonas_calceolata.AAC.1
MPKHKGPVCDYVAVAEPDAEPEAEGETSAYVQRQPTLPLTWSCKQLALVQGPACSWGRPSLGWLRKREREEKMWHHAARGGVHKGKHKFTGIEDDAV